MLPPPHSKCFNCILLPLEKFQTSWQKTQMQNSKFYYIPHWTISSGHFRMLELSWIYYAKTLWSFLPLKCPPLLCPIGQLTSYFKPLLKCYHLSEGFPNWTPTVPHPGSSHSCPQLQSLTAPCRWYPALPLLSRTELITSASPALHCKSLQGRDSNWFIFASLHVAQ